MIKAIMGALLLVIVACVFGTVVVTQEEQKSLHAKTQWEQDIRGKLVECAVNSLSRKAKDQIAHEQVDAEAPIRLNKFRWYGGLPFVDSAWRLCNRTLGADFEIGIEHDRLIMQRLKSDSEYRASVNNWKKVQAAEAAKHDEEARQSEVGHDELTYRQ